MEHTWQGSCCMECEADVSWCDNPPALGLRPRFLVAEARLEEIDLAIHRYLTTHVPIPVEWIEERNEIIEYLNSRKSGGAD